MLACPLLFAFTFLHAGEMKPTWVSTGIKGAVWDFTRTTNAVCLFLNYGGSFALRYFDRSTGVQSSVTDLGADIEGAPLFHSGWLYILRSPGKLVAMDANTGQPKWKDGGVSVPSAAGWGRIRIQDDRLLVRGATGFGHDSKEWVQIRDVATGRLIWKLDPGMLPAPEHPYATKYCSTHGMLCAVGAKDSEAGGVWVYDVPSVVPLWRKAPEELPRGQLLGLSFVGAALYASGWEASSRGWFVLWEASTGKKIWDVAVGELPGWIHSVLRVDNVIVLQGICPDEKGTWIEGHRWNSGERLWREVLAKTRITSEPLKLSAEAALFFPARAGRGLVECRNVESGRLLWSRPLTEVCGQRDLVNQKIIIADGSRLVCLDPSDGKVAWQSQPHREGAQSAIGNFQATGEGIYVWGFTHYLTGTQRIIAAVNPHLVEGRDEYWLERYPVK